MGGEWKGRREGEEQEREGRVRRVEWKGKKEGREGGAEVTDKISCLSWTEKLSYPLASQRNKQN